MMPEFFVAWCPNYIRLNYLIASNNHTKIASFGHFRKGICQAWTIIPLDIFLLRTMISVDVYNWKLIGLIARQHEHIKCKLQFQRTFSHKDISAVVHFAMHIKYRLTMYAK